MTRKQRSYANPALFATFQVGEALPWKGVWFKIAHIEQGVVVLAQDGFSQAGIEALARLRAAYETGTLGPEEVPDASK